MGKRSGAHLHIDAGNSTERPIDIENLFGHGFRITNQKGSRWSQHGIEMRARRGRPSSFLADGCEHPRITRIEVIRGLLRRFRKIAQGVNPDFQTDDRPDVPPLDKDRSGGETDAVRPR